MQIDTSVHDTCVLFVIYTVRHHLLQFSFIRTFHDPEYITLVIYHHTYCT